MKHANRSLVAILFIAMLLAVILIPAFAARAEGAAAPPPVQIDLTPLINAVIAVMATIITVKVVPWLKARTTAEQQATINAMAKVAVFAAEQLYGSGFGKDKLDYAVGYLSKHGYTIDRTAIEAAVRELTIAQDSKLTIHTGDAVDKPPDQTA